MGEALQPMGVQGGVGTVSRPNQRQPLEADLQSRIRGEVRFDDVSRLMYATDASIYQMMPVGVICPRDAQDVVESMRIAATHGVPLLPRGSGTSLAGQTVGTALVLDFTKYMHAVLEVNAEERWVRVQPGVILDELNALLRPHGLMFAPDVATSNRASIGGMMGNNSCGARSIRYGKTIDHVLEQQVVLSDASRAHFHAVPPEEWQRRGEADTLEGRIYREIWNICRNHREAIERHFPRIMRRVGGYNLDEIVRHGRYNLAHLMVGSEGTLGIVTEAKLNLVPRPRATALLVVQFRDLLAALEAVPRIVEFAPASVELIDRIILDLTRDNRELVKARTFLQGDPEALLVIEGFGETPEEAVDGLRELQRELETSGVGHAHHLFSDPARQKDVWDIRKGGLGLLMGMKGDAKPAGFVEDTAVPVEGLAAYIRDFRDLLAGHGLTACYYAHASVGCLHVRPILNLKEPADRDRMRAISEGVADLVLRYGGTISAEHGDGLARSEWQQKMFGPEVYEAFREVKRAFDPQGLLNPGKIVDAPPMHTHLRVLGGGEASYRMAHVETTLDFSRDHGFAGAVEMCSGVGACRKKLDGAMCPSYRATLEEEHSTRGRANVLRMVLSGQAGEPDLADPRIHQALDLCLECKACKSECPSNVDMAKLKYEFLAHYHARHGTPLRAQVFAQAAQAGRLGSALAPLANRLLELPLVRSLMDRWIGIDRRRPLPPFAEKTFMAWWRLHQPSSRAGANGSVMLLADTYTNYYEPEVGQAAVRVLEAFGYRVEVPALRCCGRPMISKGMLAQARENAVHNVATLADAARRGIPLVGLEPSCLVTYRDEYREFRLGASADDVAANAWMLEDFLFERHGRGLGAGAVGQKSEGETQKAEGSGQKAEGESGAGERTAGRKGVSEEGWPFRVQDRRVLYHGHCHQKAVLGTQRSLEALRMVPGYTVTPIASSCCGMAGSFGYEKEHYELSLQIGEMSLFPAVRETGEETLLVAPGTSCRHQILDATGRKAVHPVVALEMALREAEI